MAMLNLRQDSERRLFKEDLKILDPNVMKLPWTDWKEIISPVLTSHCLQRPVGHRGNYSPSLEADLKKPGWDGCGVYELGLKRMTSHLAIVGFYIGSACREEADHSLGSRILEYVRDGSHKADLINKAVDHRLTVYARIVQTKDDDEARKLEDKLLSKYNYAWNDVKNGQIREDAIYQF